MRVTSLLESERKAGRVLWTIQALLALVFLFAGGMKLAMPVDVLAQQAQLPGRFMEFIGIAECLGAIGLILPGLVHIRPRLTPLAAAGLMVIMAGATVVTLGHGDIAPALVPLVVGSLAAFVVYGRTRLAAHTVSSHLPALRKAA